MHNTWSKHLKRWMPRFSPQSYMIAKTTVEEVKTRMQRTELADAVRYDAAGLIPAIIISDQDEAVLMLGYLNEEALRLTLERNVVTFWSRSKGRLWMKGETSGNTLDVVNLYVDCDQDALLIRARANGPTCHTGNRSCLFYGGDTMIHELEQLIQSRKAEPKEGSYTTYLF